MIMEPEVQEHEKLGCGIEDGARQDFTVKTSADSSTEDKFEVMTIEVDVNSIKRSPLDCDSVPSSVADEDSQQSSNDQESGKHIKADNSKFVAFQGISNNFNESDCQDGGRNDIDGAEIQGLMQRKVYQKSIISCEVCNKVFEKRSRLVSHMLTHSDEKDHICTVCNKGFKIKSQLLRHSNTHSDVPRFCCNICGRGFKHNDVAKHIRRFHCGPRKSARGEVANPRPITNLNEGQIQSSEQITQNFSVSSNDSSPAGIIQLQTLQEPNLDAAKEQADQKSCLLKEQFPQPHSVREGVGLIDTFSGSSNDSTPVTSNSDTVFPCNKCNKSFTKRNALASHMLIHQGADGNTNPVPNKPKHTCHICFKTFTRTSGLTGHLQLHNRTEKRREPNPDFCCSICGKMFTRRTGLNAHVLQHKGVLRFWCDEPDCGKGFVHSYQVTRHKRCHLDVSPYTCHVCGKSFRHNDLAKHMRVHTGAKPYTCQHCGKAFAFSSSLKSHERMHDAHKEFFCAICNIGFTTIASLRKHSKCHDKEGEEPKDFCSFCGEQFPSAIHLSVHLQESEHCSEQQQQDASQELHLVHHVPHTHGGHHGQDLEVQSEVPHVSHEPNPISLHVTQHSDHLVHRNNEATLATLTAPNPEHIQIQLPVGAEHAAVPMSTSAGTLPVLVPFSVPLPLSVPFGVNSTSQDQLQLNHFLSWEQKY